EVSFDYIDGIHKNWYTDPVSRLEDVETRKEQLKTEKIESKEATKNTYTPKKKKVYTQFHNFKQRTTKYSADELEKKVRKNFEKKING
ncbi:MAG: hypothetical protein ACTH0S_04545, partial [Senegalia sp. (in: firmicutes)]